MGNGKSKKINILFLGLDNSGKTTMMYDIRLGKDDNIVKKFTSTNSLNYEILNLYYKKKLYKMHMYDPSGRIEFRSIWKSFYNNMIIDILFYLVDSTKFDRLKESKDEFIVLKNEFSLQKTPIVIILNPCTPKITDRISPAYLIDTFNISKDIKKGNIIVIENFTSSQMGMIIDQTILKQQSNILNQSSSSGNMISD